MDLDLATPTEQRAEKAQHLEAFSAINLRHIRGNVAEALTHFGSFSLLEEYTKHDISHIDAMLGLYDWLIPDATKKIMTSADWLLVTLTTYLHDFGLLVTRDEYDMREGSNFSAYKEGVFESEDAAFQDYRAQLEHMDDVAAEKFMYQEFVRANHAPRIRSWLNDSPDAALGFDPRISDRLKVLFSDVEETFREDVGVVCESHHLDDLLDPKKYPLSKPYGRTHDEEANVQYAAILLRSADLLHITKDRVPTTAALIINPRNPKSQMEWAKQSAVRTVRAKLVTAEDGTSPRPADTIEVHATFKEAEGYFGLTSYLQYADEQISQTHGWAVETENRFGLGYQFPWRHIDTTNIEAKGFVAETFAFSIDQAKILDLLTGHTLYNDTRVVVRELVQNSLDAVRLVETIIDPASYSPQIEVTWNSGKRTLEVLDNGVGMTQRVIEDNFLRVGASHYQDPEFIKEHPNFSPISRFGIGVLSAFMVADDVSVVTSHAGEKEARQLSLRDVHGKYLVRLIDKQSAELPELLRSHGTSVRIKLRPSANLASVKETLAHWIVVPGCKVTLTIDGGEPVAIGAESTVEALRTQLIEAKMVHVVEGGLHGRFDETVEIRQHKSSGLEIAYAVKWSKWIQEWSFLPIEVDRERDRENQVILGTCVGGIRVTEAAPGYRLGGIAAIANAYGPSAPRTNVARSAIEHTKEYDDMLRNIYAAYTGHISTEMLQFEEQRASSLTGAAQEASYLVREISSHELASRNLFKEALRTLPAIVLEQDGERKRVSLDQLSQFEKVVTIESSIVRSLEQVLSTIRGAESASLRRVLDAVGAPEHLGPLSEPLVCSLSPTSYFSSLFVEDWEVTKLKTDDTSRTLYATWEKVRREDHRWLSMPDATRPPVELTSLFQSSLRFGANDPSGVELVVAANPGSVVVEGIKEKLVRCQGRTLVLPSHALQDIQLTSVDDTSVYRLWIMNWIYTTVTGRIGGGSRRMPMVGDGQIHQDSVDQMLRMLDASGAFQFVLEDSVRDVLSRITFETFDVQRWDRHPEGSGA
jgi:hypothetical protein